MDENLTEAVKVTFIQLHKEGIIYRAIQLELQDLLSDRRLELMLIASIVGDSSFSSQALNG